MAKVAILGGGVAGLSAAHELAERGFSVSVYETKPIWGGKARSMGKPGSGTNGRRNLPGEHGFRFFPGFYKHLPDTMKRIPYGNNGQFVFDNLVGTTQIGLLQSKCPKLVLPANFPTTLGEWMTAINAMFGPHLGVPAMESEFFAHQLFVILTSCAERRVAEYEKVAWWKFIEADNKSPEYQKMMAIGLTRSLVAMRAQVASTRTVGDILLQLIINQMTPGVMTDRVLNGPTNDVWILPWIAYLKGLKVELNLGASFKSLKTDGKNITSATVTIGGQDKEVQADYYICAVPVEVMQRLLTDPIKNAAPSLAKLDQLGTEWMNGIQFYLSQDVPILNGHSIYLDSTWALTSISQHQFWNKVDLSQFGDGQVKGIISVDVSDWFAAGDQVVKKPANECTLEEIKNEVWAQLKAHLNQGGVEPVEDKILIDWHIDPDILYPRNDPTNEGNAEPLLVNTVDTWQYRPDVTVEIPNLFLASDYVRTYTDLATMEGANEAARRAVNAILDRSRSAEDKCEIWPLHEPVVFAPLREYDYCRFKLGWAHGKYL